MSLVKRSAASPRQIAANRSNARKSTGPRTQKGKRRAALNSLKHGCYAQPDTQLHEAMRKLGEDPGEYEGLFQALIEAWKPQDAMQSMLVRDLVNLYWIKIRSQRAEAELQVPAYVGIDPERYLVPATHRWSLMINQDATLDRQIEAKVRLLLRLRHTRAKPSNSGGRYATHRRVLGFPARRASRARPAGSGTRSKNRRRAAGTNAGKKYEMSNQETKPLSAAESTT